MYKRSLLVSADHFDWLMTGWSCLLVGGFYLDGWAHLHQRNTRSILTPWHLLLYCSAVGTTIFLFTQWLQNRASGSPWRSSLPPGYGLSALGAGLFFVGAAADPLWHLRFGFEVDIETLLSPPHLLLGLSTTLVVSGPFRARWRWLPEQGAPGWRMLLPLLLSLTLTFSLFTFFTEFIHPVVNTWAGKSFMWRYPHKRTLPAIGEALGIASILFQTGMLMGTLLLLLRRWSPPFGSVLMLCGLNISLMSLFRDEYRMLPGTLVAGLLADLFIWRFRPSARRLGALRVFAVALPLLLYGLYFLTLAATEGILWSSHLWLGTWAMTGITGLLISFLVIPPATGHSA